MELIQRFPALVRGENHDRLLQRFHDLKQFEQAHVMNMPKAYGGKVEVTSRKKLVFSLAADGCFGLYLWDQTLDCYQLVEPMPGFGQELLGLLKAAEIPGPERLNHFLVTFSPLGHASAP